ncbi:ParB/RepB/Spo0J family partition protein [Mycolicibacterium peregrinum]|uniref:ParB/RepB/Spo0J family partition protein n=1 Tax=Mycolicibacterium peregrinum TaxID=43304 RepID=UPI0009EF009E|nr:ParB/RepB/Spo0J family partition protein [Mycolicibacterium peregrinum]
MTGTSTANKHTARKASGRRTANKLTRYAGGAESEVFLAAAKDANPVGGITAGLASMAAADGQRFIEAPPSAIAPHPYNIPTRSIPKPDNPRWVELVNSISAVGVQVPVLLVTRKAFVAARPVLADQVSSDAEYITIYGHRRCAAALAAGIAAVPAVVDDTVLSDGGDLDAMANENLGREDLTEIEQAEMFARYSELGYGQRAIAEKVGMSQSTVSRRLSLLLLTPEVLEAVAADRIRSTEAAKLAGELPYGPQRPWQEEVEPEQDSDDRRADQIAAFELVLSGTTPVRAAERVVAERRARNRAAEDGVEIVDAKERFGPDYQRHSIGSPEEAAGPIVAAIDPLQGGLIYFPADLDTDASAADSTQPQRPPAPSPNEAKLNTAAKKARRAACPRLVSSPPPREKLLPLLAGQYAAGLSALASGSTGWALAFEFSRVAGLSTAADHHDAATYRRAAARETELKRQVEIAWACAVAAYELRAADKNRGSWDHLDVTYLELLQDRAAYSPTTWELERIGAV